MEDENNIKPNGCLLVFEGVDKSGKTSMINKLIKLGLVDYYVKFSEPAAHSGVMALLKEYQIHTAIAKAMQTTRTTGRFQVFDRFIPSEIAYSTVLRGNDWYVNRKQYDDVILGLKMLKSVRHEIIYLDIDYDEYIKRGGDELTEDQFGAIRSAYSSSVASTLSKENLTMNYINNVDYQDGWLKFKQVLAGE